MIRITRIRVVLDVFRGVFFFFFPHSILCDVKILGSGRVPDQLVNLDMKHGVEAKNYKEVSVGSLKCLQNYLLPKITNVW